MKIIASYVDDFIDRLRLYGFDETLFEYVLSNYLQDNGYVINSNLKYMNTGLNLIKGRLVNIEPMPCIVQDIFANMTICLAIQSCYENCYIKKIDSANGKILILLLY